MSDEPDQEMRRAMGERLCRVRIALGMTQKAITKNAGISVTGWSAWEGGRNTIDFVRLTKIAKRHGFNTEYISSGDLSGVRKGLADLIQELEEHPERTAPRRGRPPTAGSQRP